MESTQSKKSSYQLETLELAYKMAKKGAKKGLCDAKSSFLLMARLNRLERLTHSLEGCCSIQLSYRRSALII